MIRISSSLTLGLSVFIPVFWYIFFGCFTIFLFFIDNDDLPFSNPMMVRLSFLIFFLVFGFLIYYFLVKLKRVEIEDEFVYVTNYFTTIKIHISKIVRISEFSFFGFQRIKLILQSPTIYGKKIRFVCNAANYKLFKDHIRNINLKLNN